MTDSQRIEQLEGRVKELEEMNKQLWRLIHKRSGTIMPDGSGRAVVPETPAGAS